MAALRNGSKCSHTTCMLRFFSVSRLALNPNLIFEIGSKNSTKKRSYITYRYTYGLDRNLYYKGHTPATANSLNRP